MNLFELLNFCLQPPETYFTFAVTPAGFHLIDAVFDDIEEEREHDSSAAT